MSRRSRDDRHLISTPSVRRDSLLDVRVSPTQIDLRQWSPTVSPLTAGASLVFRLQGAASSGAPTPPRPSPRPGRPFKLTQAGVDLSPVGRAAVCARKQQRREVLIAKKLGGSSSRRDWKSSVKCRR